MHFGWGEVCKRSSPWQNCPSLLCLVTLHNLREFVVSWDQLSTWHRWPRLSLKGTAELGALDQGACGLRPATLLFHVLTVRMRQHTLPQGIVQCACMFHRTCCSLDIEGSYHLSVGGTSSYLPYQERALLPIIGIAVGVCKVCGG
jgi:hypothetical protein